MNAIGDDDAETVTMILEDGLDPNSRYNDTAVSGGDRDLTLLHWAARFDSPSAAEVFIAHILRSLESLMSLSVQTLIEFGADVEAKNSLGNTPLHYCSLFGSASVAKVRFCKHLAALKFEFDRAF